ncbi:hypothetical protein Efla_002997 [Eimeria flavescens]
MDTPDRLINTYAPDRRYNSPRAPPEDPVWGALGWGPPGRGPRSGKQQASVHASRRPVVPLLPPCGPLPGGPLLTVVHVGQDADVADEGGRREGVLRLHGAHVWSVRSRGAPLNTNEEKVEEKRGPPGEASPHGGPPVRGPPERVARPRIGYPSVA